MAITSTINTRPTEGASFFSDLEQFLAEEDAERFNLIFNPHVVSGGLHGTGAGLTGDPGDTTAFPQGFYVNETGTITYNDNTAHHWVIIFKDTTTDPGGDWVRVSGTHYLFDPVSASQPTVPTGGLILIDVVTSGGSITTVTDLRNTTAFTTPEQVFKAKVSSDDTTTDYLINKFTAGTGVTLTETNGGGDETITIDSDGKTSVSTNDTVRNFLEDKITAGDGISETVINAFGDEELQLAIDLATTSGLEFSSGELRVNTVTNGVVAIDSNGTVLDINGTATIIGAVDVASDFVIVYDDSLTGVKTRKVTPHNLIPIATQSEAETGTDNVVRMTPLRVQQQIAAQSGTVDQDAIASAAVGQGELITTTGEVSTSNATLTNLTLPGGEYGFYSQVRVSSSTGSGNFGNLFSNTSFVTNIALLNSAGGGPTTRAQQRYIQASPPYDMGDGDVASFIFVMMQGSKIIAHYHAPDPPWANNGPTNIRPDRVDKKTGKIYKMTKNIDPDKLKLMNPDFITESEIEVDAAFKNSDMSLIPHPFPSNDLVGKQVVLLDPMSSLVLRLEEMKEAGGDVGEILYGDYLRIDNRELGRGRPPGVMSAAVRMK